MNKTLLKSFILSLFVLHPIAVMADETIPDMRFFYISSLPILILYWLLALSIAYLSLAVLKKYHITISGNWRGWKFFYYFVPIAFLLLTINLIFPIVNILLFPFLASWEIFSVSLGEILRIMHVFTLLTLLFVFIIKKVQGGTVAELFEKIYVQSAYLLIIMLLSVSILFVYNGTIKVLGICSLMISNEDRHFCLGDKAENDGNISLCRKAWSGDARMEDFCISDVAAKRKDISICQNTKDPAQAFYCIKNIDMTKLTDPALCEKIPDSRLGNSQGRNECFEETASILKDQSLCLKISDSYITQRCQHRIR